MSRIPVTLLLLALSLSSIGIGYAQKFQPKSIQFKGDSEFSDLELMTAAGLKLGDVLTSAEMNQHSQLLMDTGLFEGLTYKFDGQDLVFQITPSSQLYPLRLENLPLGSATDLDAKLRKRLPLYHGKVPGEGGILNDICTALQDELKTLGMKVTVGANPFSDPVSHKVAAISFSVTAPAVLIGDVEPDGTVDPSVRPILAKAAGMSYDREGSSKLIEKSVIETYREMGFLDADAHATSQPTPVITSDAIRIPFQVSVTAGPIYKVAAIQLAPGMAVSQADFDKQSMTHPGDVADGTHIRQNWEFIARQYHNHGYMKARVIATPTLDRAQSTVRYAVDAEAGPVYNMGNLTIENVSEDLRSAMMAAWKLPAGAVFNEGAIRGFFATHDVNPKLERVFAAVNTKYTLHLNDDNKTVDVSLRLEKRP